MKKERLDVLLVKKGRLPEKKQKRSLCQESFL